LARCPQRGNCAVKTSAEINKQQLTTDAIDWGSALFPASQELRTFDSR